MLIENWNTCKMLEMFWKLKKKIQMNETKLIFIGIRTHNYQIYKLAYLTGQRLISGLGRRCIEIDRPGKFDRFEHTTDPYNSSMGRWTR